VSQHVETSITVLIELINYRTRRENMATKKYEAGVKEYRQTSPGRYLPPTEGASDVMIAQIFQTLNGDCHAYPA
jgi:hypothetical protein